MAYEQLMGMGQFSISMLPKAQREAFEQKMQEKKALDAAFSSSTKSSAYSGVRKMPSASSGRTQTVSSKTTQTVSSKTTQTVSQKSEQAAEKAAQDAVQEAVETAEIEADDGEEALVAATLEEPASFISRMPVWGWAAIGGGVLVLGIGIVALARK